MCSSTSRRSTAPAIESSLRASAFSSNRSKDKRVRRPSRCVLPSRGDKRQTTGSEERRERPDRKSEARSGRNSDEQALALRDSGQTYAAVARSVGFKRAVDAQAAFLRAMRQREGDERNLLIQRESVRLDELEARIRTRDAADPVKMERRLTALANMRQMLR